MLLALAALGVPTEARGGVDQIAAQPPKPRQSAILVGAGEPGVADHAASSPDGLCSYSAAMKELGNADRHEVGGRLNNRAENSHQPFRRRERAMQRFRSMKTLEKFSSVHAQVHNHFNQERHLVTRQVYAATQAGKTRARAFESRQPGRPKLTTKIIANSALRNPPRGVKL